MKVKITGTGSYLPEKVLTNMELSGMVDTSDEWIMSRTGIKERRISCGEATWQLALNASVTAMDRAGITAQDIDMIVCATITPDYFFPSMGCILQHKLGAKKAIAFDVSAACSGFVYAMDIAKSYMECGKAETVLVVSSECLSKIVDYGDRKTCVLFGDGSGAAVLQKTDDRDVSGIRDTLLISDGDGAEALLCRAVKKTTVFSKMKSIVKLGNKTPDKFTLSMDGQDVFKFAVSTVPKVIHEILEKNNLTTDDVKYIVPHQANVRIIQSTVKKLAISEDKMVVNLDKYGNTSSASVPICLDELGASGKLNKGDLIILIAFGAGFTAGGALINW